MTDKIIAIRNLYRHGRITKQQLYDCVPNIITAEEYFQITGEEYN